LASGVDKEPGKEPPNKDTSSEKNKEPPNKDTSSNKNNQRREKDKRVHIYSVSPVQVLWVATSIALIIAIYLAYLEAVSPASFIDYILPRAHFNITQTGNATEITKIIPENIHAPFVPRFVLIWGFIGAATYLLKVTTKKMREDDFHENEIPGHIARLFIGTTLAVVAYFTLATGGFFGLTIDVTKISHPGLIQYVYAVISFIAGYSVRHIIQIISNIANSMFMIQTEEDVEKEKKAGEKGEKKAGEKETTTKK
jgi:hypothetical protein